jgi:TetR/AcrR family transcriptional regulator
MIYHYFGNKDGLYLAALERVYEDLRGTEKTLDLADLAPEAAIRRLIEFTFDYSREHPELISLINNENLHGAQHLRRSTKVRELHSPFVALIRDILRRGVAQGVFRSDLDPVDLYITIAAVGYFYLSNNKTLSTIFGRDLGSAAACRRRKRHNVDIILHAMRA